MYRSVSLLLVLSVSLYSTPMKADSYDSDPESYTDLTSDNAGTSCPVTPEPAEVQQQASYPSDDEYAEQPADESTPSQETYAHQDIDQGNYTDQETMVTPESSQQSQRKGSKYWKNILVAVVVVAVAVTALLIVHSHEGHKSHH